MDNKELIQGISNDFQIIVPQEADINQLRTILSEYINHLIVNNFSQLINLLYRLDVSEKKLQNWLLENTTEDAGRIIADLVIERQLQKIKSRKESGNNNDIPDSERW